MFTYIRSGVAQTTHEVFLMDTYIFLLLHVRATRKVSYMRYKQHLGESCNVTRTFKEVPVSYTHLTLPTNREV